MEEINQDPRDIEGYNSTSTGMIWKVLTGVFLVTTIIFAIVAFTSGNKSNSSDSQSGSSDNGNSASTDEVDDGSDDGYALKDFDVDIPGLVNAAGFQSGSILTLKANSTGEYLIGEVSSSGKVAYAYRVLPDGAWLHSGFLPDGEALCGDLEKSELDAFSGVTVKNQKNLNCIVSESEDEDEESDSSTSYTIEEALKNNLYKSSN